MDSSLPTQIKACFNEMETSQFMLTVFWDSQGVAPLAHFQKHGENLDSASYCEALLNFRRQFSENFQVSWLEGYCFMTTMPDPIQPKQPRR
jgi:hypothetical protein